MSKFTLADLINASEAYLGEPLVSCKTLQKINNFSSLIPPTSVIFFESRLRDNKTEVDYSIPVNKEDGGDAIFAGYNPNKSPDVSLYKHPIWQRVKKFCQIWHKSNTPINQYVTTIWLEMDNHELDKPQPVPCFLFNLSYQATKNPEWITETALTTLYGKSISPAIQTIINNCINNLPKFGYIVYIGTMLSRSTSPIRLCVKIPISDVVPYLKALGWNHNFERVSHVLNNLVKDFAENVVLNLDVRDTIMPRVGVEIKPAFQAKGWDVILERLVENELCYASEKETFLNWQGKPKELQDKELRRQLTFMPPERLDNNNLPLIVRRLNHIKIDIYPDSLLKAKMYYGLIYLYQPK